MSSSCGWTGQRAVDLFLPTAFESLLAKKVDRVEEVLHREAVEPWREWAEGNPRPSARKKVARALGLRRRDGSS